MSQLSPFLPTETVFVMTVNGQVGAQEDESSWFYRQGAAALQVKAANEQQRTFWPERREMKKVLISTSSLQLNAERAEIVLTMDGKNEEQNTASPPRQEEVHSCLISSNPLSHTLDPRISQILSNTCRREQPGCHS